MIATLNQTKIETKARTGEDDKPERVFVLTLPTKGPLTLAQLHELRDLIGVVTMRGRA